MKAYLNCIPCFFQQVIQAGKMAGLSDPAIKDMMDMVGMELHTFPPDASPPEMAKIIQKLLSEKLGTPDPYKQVKEQSNQTALAVYPELREIAAQAEDPLLAAVELACAGNVIDYGVYNKGLDVSGEIRSILEQEQETVSRESEELFSFKTFRKKLNEAKRLIYVGDNAGEIVFDRILIEVIAEQYPDLEIYFAVRGTPVLNDCLAEDAYACGIDASAHIVSSGVTSPGLILNDADPEFRKLFESADIIISKGQGNYEALSGTTDAPIFFLLIIKCDVIAEDIGGEVRSLVLKENSRSSEKQSVL